VSEAPDLFTYRIATQAGGSTVDVRVIATNEEEMIASHTQAAILRSVI